MPHRDMVQKDELTLPACVITLRSEPAADKIRFSTFLCYNYIYLKYCMCNKFSTNRFLCQCTTHKSNKQRITAYRLTSSSASSWFAFSTPQSNQSRQTKNTSLPTQYRRLCLTISECHYIFWCFVTDVSLHSLNGQSAVWMLDLYESGVDECAEIAYR
jgi:hypothetical protein